MSSFEWNKYIPTQQQKAFVAGFEGRKEHTIYNQITGEIYIKTLCEAVAVGAYRRQVAKLGKQVIKHDIKIIEGVSENE